MKFKKQEEKEKSRKYLEVTALIMLIVSITLFILSLCLSIYLFSTLSDLSITPLYKGVENRDKENDSLDEVKDLLDEVANIYEASYALEIKREEIDEYVINGLVSAYGDKYAVYLDPKETYVTLNSKNNLIMGVGIYSKAVYEDFEDEYTAYLIDVYKDSPAEKAGLEIGDILIAVNGKTFSKTKYKYSDMVDDVRGEEGTTVDLTYLDASDNNKEKTVTITRGKVSTRSVICTELSNDTALLEIREFDFGTDEELIGFIEELRAKGINNYIFDLRDNGGGIKETAINILDYLLPSGLLMKEISKDGVVMVEDFSDENYIDFNSVCLVNEGTASAAELMTQVLKDYNKTTIIGEKTLGKGTVCTWFPLSNGSSLYISTSKYITMSGADIEGKGIEPDIELKMKASKEKIRYKLNTDEDDLIQRALDELHK